MTVERRLPLAVGASLAVNLVVWAAVGSAAAYRIVAPQPPIEIQRIVVHKDGKKTVKVVKPEEVKKKVARIVKQPRLTPPPKPVEAPKPAPPRTEPRPAPHPAPPPPQGAHNRVVTSKPTPGASPKAFSAPPGGNAALGKPTEAQAPGNAVTNPPDPPKTAPPAAPVQPDPKPDPKPPVAPVESGPKTPAVKPPDPTPEIKPKKKGPSRDAEHSHEVNPTIPDDLKSQEFKKFVRVRVDIPADGAFTVTLRTSSGNDEVDRRVLDALKKWTWKPKLVEGEPVDSTQLFRFEFEIK